MDTLATPFATSRRFAEDFRARRGESHDVLVIAPGAGSTMAQESATFLVSYFAGTGLPWFGRGPYPRDIFSMVAKPPNYAYLPETRSTAPTCC